MKKLILIGGVLAGGKSTFSHIIGEKFCIPVVNKDRLKEILGDNIPTKNREENKKLSKISPIPPKSENPPKPPVPAPKDGSKAA